MIPTPPHHPSHPPTRVSVQTISGSGRCVRRGRSKQARRRPLRRRDRARRGAKGSGFGLRRPSSAWPPPSGPAPTRDRHTQGPSESGGTAQRRRCAAGVGGSRPRWMDPVVTRPSTFFHGSEVHPPPTRTTLYRLYVLRKKGFRTKTRGKKAEGVGKDGISVGVREIRELRQRLVRHHV